MAKRTRIEITGRLLRLAATKEGQPKTRLMFAAFLSTSQINEYLRQLFESGLVEYVAGSRRYRTTSKGMELLESYEKLSSMVENMPHAPSIQK